MNRKNYSLIIIILYFFAWILTFVFKIATYQDATLLFFVLFGLTLAGIQGYLHDIQGYLYDIRGVLENDKDNI